jgi:hypothetical protein
LHAIGGVTRFRQECRDMRRVSLIENFVQDIRYGVRTLRKAPLFSSVVIGTLALGIGGITAVFSVVQAVLLAPLPYEAPGRLVRVYQHERNDPSTLPLWNRSPRLPPRAGDGTWCGTGKGSTCASCA